MAQRTAMHVPATSTFALKFRHYQCGRVLWCTPMGLPKLWLTPHCNLIFVSEP
jgi:hypothetical protein